MASSSSALAATAVQLSLLTAAAAARPHILMMLADDWGSYDASYRMQELGRVPDISTPNIDALGAAGVRMSNYYVQPICTPTRSVLMTGRYSIHTGSEHILFGASEPSCLPVDLPLLPAAFKALNYHTAMVGKWHLGYVNDTCSPWKRGFDSYLGYLNGVEGYYSHGMGAWQDFHECANQSSGHPPADYSSAYGAAVASPKPAFQHKGGAMPAGKDATGLDAKGGAQQNVTLAQAEVLCSAAGDGCYGFTFESKLPIPPGVVQQVFFKKEQSVIGDADWQSYVKTNMPAPKTCDQCTFRYEGQYSTHVYTQHAQGLLKAWKPGAAPLMIYLAWQAVHEPMAVPASYLKPYAKIKDPSRQIYAGMLSALDEGIGNITKALKSLGMFDNTVMVLSNDNGGMSGSYGLGCCNCGTSCGGLNYPYRGWKDSFFEGGFRGIGFVHSVLLQKKGYVFKPLIGVMDWYATLLSAALTKDSATERAAAEKALATIMKVGPIDSVDQWAALSTGNQTGARDEILLAGIDIDKKGAAIRSGKWKLMVGSWGSPTWCDLNVSGHSPGYPAPAGNSTGHGPGGEGGLYCIALKNASSQAPAGVEARTPTGLQAHDELGQKKKATWWNTTFGLFDVEADPREMHDLQRENPEVVARLFARFVFWNKTTAGTIHLPNDKNGSAHANATDCWSPWRK